MTAEYKAINMMSSKRNIQNVIRQKTHMAPSHRDVDELESEFMDLVIFDAAHIVLSTVFYY